MASTSCDHFDEIPEEVAEVAENTVVSPSSSLLGTFRWRENEEKKSETSLAARKDGRIFRLQGRSLKNQSITVGRVSKYNATSNENSKTRGKVWA